MPEVDQGNWRLLLGAVSAPVFLFLILCYWWLPESPRFWVEVGDAQKVEETIELMCRTNGDPVPDMTELRCVPAQAPRHARRSRRLVTRPARAAERVSKPPTGSAPAVPTRRPSATVAAAANPRWVTTPPILSRQRAERGPSCSPVRCG